ncbi:MAG: ATP-binding protein [Pseudomonadota bacterium]
MSLRRHFAVQATLRAVLLLLVMLALSWVVFRTPFVITPLVLGLLCIALVTEFVVFVQRTNREVARFFDSIRHGDFSHRIDPSLRGARFAELGHSMREVVTGLQQLRHAGEEDRLRLQAIVEHVPVPMFSVIGAHKVVLHNHAARRLFAAHSVTTVDDLNAFGAELAVAVRDQHPGESGVVRLTLADGVTQRMTLSLTEIVVGQVGQRLVTLQNISDALAASELEAWQQMGQVLAHEIMNSLTPVASLAGTAQALLAAGTEEEEDLTRARDAVDTVARRAESLMGFVQGYRQFTRLPAPVRAAVELRAMFADIAALLEEELAQAKASLTLRAPSAGVRVQADRAQLEQVLINLVRNALDALGETPEAKIRLSASLSREGRVNIEVADNGPGVPEDLRERVFVPYYTTRAQGTGVGLALTRQVMLAHGGAVDIGKAADFGGARVTLRF